LVLQRREDVDARAKRGMTMASNASHVMAGLVPAIHVFNVATS
jgi:hypothetical protein